MNDSAEPHSPSGNGTALSTIEPALSVIVPALVAAAAPACPSGHRRSNFHRLCCKNRQYFQVIMLFEVRSCRIKPNQMDEPFLEKEFD